MTRTKLPEIARRVPVSLTLSNLAIATLDAIVSSGKAATRSAAAELLIFAGFAAVPRPDDAAPKKRRASR